MFVIIVLFKSEGTSIHKDGQWGLVWKRHLFGCAKFYKLNKSKESSLSKLGVIVILTFIFFDWPMTKIEGSDS